jgi:hypothetical protein
MRWSVKSHFGQTRDAQSGQVILVAALLLVGLLGAAALTIDIGYAMHAQNELQASTNAAATAGASDLPNSTAVATANLYSGISTGKNAYGDLPNVTMVPGYPKLRCLASTGLVCFPVGSTTANAIEVEQTVSVPTFLGKIFGMPKIQLTTDALASMRNGTGVPANIVMILDATISMSYADDDATCRSATGIAHPTQLDCAKWGVRTMLTQLAPCSPLLTSCGTVTGGNVANPVTEISLLTFPGLASTADASSDYLTCGAQFQQSYFTKYAAAGTSPPYYTIVPFSSDYRTSDKSGLNGAASNLVQAVDWKDGNTCNTSSYGIQNNQPGTNQQYTYYSGIIQEAATNIANLTYPRSTQQSAIIIFGDGDSQAPSSDFISNGATLSPNQCAKAVTAAQNAAAYKNAANLNTWVYTIAFGATTSGSCTYDTSRTSGCVTMQSMASDLTKFYSDDSAGCRSPDHPSITSLDSIFTAISHDFLSTRLLPLNTM